MNSSNFLFWAVYPSEVCIMTMHLHYIYDSAGSEKKKQFSATIDWTKIHFYNLTLLVNSYK